MIDVVAGVGSYEPTDRQVTAVEPSASMRSQRPAHLSPAIDAIAEDLPFADATFDAALVEIVQWPGKTYPSTVTLRPVIIHCAAETP